MRWLAMHYRRAMELFGLDYPPSYMLIADLAVIALCAGACVQRLVAGVAGWQWLWVAAAVATAVLPHLICLLVKARPWLPGLPILTVVSVLLFWQVPTHVDVATLQLPLCATIAAAVSSRKQSIIATLALTATAVGGTVTGVIEQGWLVALMIGFAGVVGHLMQKQLVLLHAERTARTQQLALDRAAIAGEVHDVLAHSLSILMLNVTAARRAIEEDGGSAEAVDALRDAEQVGRCAMNDVRRTVELLRTTDAGIDTPQPGLADLADLIDGFRRAGVQVEVTLGETGQVSAGTELAVYRVVQESLSNATKHAPGAPVRVVVERRDGVLRVRVANPVPKAVRRTDGGSGLVGMRSRVHNRGGTLRAGVLGGVWTVEADFGEAVADIGDSPVAQWESAEIGDEVDVR